MGGCDRLIWQAYPSGLAKSGDRQYFDTFQAIDHSHLMIFGKQETFAISYRPKTISVSNNWSYAYCHLILGGHFIGSYDEICLLNTWAPFLLDFRNKIERFKGNFSHPLFQGRTDEELFQLIRKPNLLEEEFDRAYDYLPQLPNEIWRKHILFFDETIDAYSIAAVESSGQLKFIWKDGEIHVRIMKLAKFFP